MFVLLLVKDLSPLLPLLVNPHVLFPSLTKSIKFIHEANDRDLCRWPRIGRIQFGFFNMKRRRPVTVSEHQFCSILAHTFVRHATDLPCPVAFPFELKHNIMFRIRSLTFMKQIFLILQPTFQVYVMLKCLNLRRNNLITFSVFQLRWVFSSAAVIYFNKHVFYYSQF